MNGPRRRFRGGLTQLGVRQPRRSSTAAVAVGAVLATAGRAQAHGFGQRYDLPVPLWLWVTGAAAAVVLSFAVIGVFVRGTPGLHGYPRLNLLRWPIGRFLAHRAVRLTVKVVAVALLVLIVATGLLGHVNPTRNLAPTAVWVLWWVGFAYVSALLGNLWTLVNPWKSLFEGVETLFRRGDPDDEFTLGVPYAPWLGAWPGVVLFLAFSWGELVFSGRAFPRQLALMIVVYSLITWTGMFCFGRTVWLRHGDPFALAFRVLARFAPTELRVTDPSVCEACPVECRDRDGECVDCEDCFARAPAPRREWNVRPFGMGLLRNEEISASMVVFVVLLLSTVTFDGFTATPLWADLESAMFAVLPAQGVDRLAVIETMGLLVFPILFLAVYHFFAGQVATAGGRQRSTGAVANAFVVSLVPIAIAYHLAHYFTYLLIQGQLVIPLASDPFGVGWDLFGTAASVPEIGIVGARFAWYTAVIAIVLGHIVAVYVAHVIALRAFQDRRRALRSQYPMLVLMVSYTMVSLWIIAQPIVETGPKG